MPLTPQKELKINSITVTGHLGKDAEIRSTPSGDKVMSFSVGDSQGKDKNSIWWNCQLWGKRAESLGQYLVKGQAVTVVGTVSEREWSDRDGMKRKAMDVRVNDIALQGGKPQTERTPAPASKPVGKPVSHGSGFDDIDDSDCPF